MELLPIQWYFQPPIDFEHKEYTLYAYLKNVDESFRLRKLSPHLLHIEKLLHELNLFQNNINQFHKEIDKRTYKYFDNPLIDNLYNENINTIVDIVNFSIPQLDGRLLHGKSLFKRYNQILY